MARNEEGKIADAADRRGKVMAGLVVAAMLGCLGACTQIQPAPGSSAEQAPGSFSVEIGGQMTTMIGAAK